ncbi:type II toxin-antitoxin system RelE/ParE family toxin [Brevundimonas sp.]|uniref:type II toxin-antitoxin system RelE/ParE family toxin n=1 Tax=Brevundimonas sp. TaxID=1871086 RepID=UPI003F72AEA2
MPLRILKAASHRLDDIYRYTFEQWGAAQAERYINGVFNAMAGIESHLAVSRPVPAEFGVEGYFVRYERHVIYWRLLPNGDVGVVTVLHERMHQIDRFRDDFGV